MAELASSPEVITARERLSEGLLASALQRQIAEGAVPSAEEVAARAAELAGRQSNEPVLNFQHIFFRLDRGLDRNQVLARAEAVVAEAQADGDFSALVREHSDSADAAAGGLVSSVRPSDLDPASAAALAALDEGEVSPVLETRTGLHVLRLIRRLAPEPPSPAQLEASARNLLQQERLAAAQGELLAGLEAGAGEAGDPQQLLVEEAVTRGLETPELTARVEQMIRLQLLESLFNRRRQEHDAGLGEDVLRPFYDAQPSLFATPEKTRVELIFVAQGGDSFATQKRLEKEVAALRAGASFADTARRISEHPSAEDGGDLGLHPASEWSRYGPPVAAALPGLEVGEISDPIYCTGRVLSRDAKLLRGGFAVLRLAEREPTRERGFEEALDDVRRAYAGQHRAQLDEELQARILADAGFEILRLPEPGEFLR